ncbi:MAG: hypothetical protein R2867_23005 [Caldilineaceae bacterium]
MAWLPIAAVVDCPVDPGPELPRWRHAPPPRMASAAWRVAWICQHARSARFDT